MDISLNSNNLDGVIKEKVRSQLALDKGSSLTYHISACGSLTVERTKAKGVE